MALSSAPSTPAWSAPPLPDSVRAVAAPDPAVGLTADEVADRRARGLSNVTSGEGIRRSFGDIVRANVCTRFNAILGTLLLVVLATGELRDALFGAVLVANTLIGIIQELRAKRTLDRLAVVVAPNVRVVRAGQLAAIPPCEVVADEVIDLGAGDQVPVDGVALTATNLEVDESLLTGESDPVAKPVGARLLSGSLVIAGRGRITATAVGDAAYAARLAREARRFTTVHSELRAATDTILKVGTWIIAPAALLLLASQLGTDQRLSEALRATVAGVAAIVPEGLVLLTSVAFAVGVIRLARRRALLQELPAVEVLARVDVVCLDKTGTLTSGTLHVAGIDPLDGEHTPDTAHAALGALAALEPHPNPTLRAIAEAAGDPGWHAESTVAFTSARRWSGAAFTGQGTWLLGAPEALLDPGDPLHEQVGAHAAAGARVLLLAHTPAPLADRLPELPDPRRPVALIRLTEQLRPDAAATIAYLRAQGAAVKVISGDHPATVAAIAEQAGVPGATDPVDARSLPDDRDQLAATLEQASVLARVGPHHKRAIVHALQHRGHTVAMTGDGVNDVLALKHADIGIAMRSGSPAARAVAQVTLLDDTFTALPALLAEGRRVIANVERVAKLFVTKSVYATLLVFTVGLAQLPFLFFPRHLTIISTLTIGIPAFFLALAPNTALHRPGFLGRVARFAIPAGAVAAAATFTAYTIAGQQPAVTLAGQRTSAVLALFLVAFWILLLLARPLTEPRTALLAAMAASFLLALALPEARSFFDLQLPPLIVTLATIGVAALAIAAVEVGWQLLGWMRRRILSRHHRVGSARTPARPVREPKGTSAAQPAGAQGTVPPPRPGTRTPARAGTHDENVRMHKRNAQERNAPDT